MKLLQWLVIHTEVVVIKGDGEHTTGRFADDAETVTFALDDIDNGPRDRRTTVVSANTVYQTRVGNWNNTSRLVIGEHWECGIVPPVSELDNLVNQSQISC